MLNEDEVIKTFNNLSPQHIKQLEDINFRIQQNTSPWGKWAGGEVDDSGAIQMHYMVQNPIIEEYLRFMYERGLVLDFDWSGWSKGREWFRSIDENKYENLDSLTILKLLTTVIRNDRFCEGVLVDAFEQGIFPKLIDKLVKQKLAPKP